MGRYINTENINFKGKFSCGLNDNGILYVPFREIPKIIEDVPTANVEEVKYGKWITITIPRHDPHGEKFWLCTNCEHVWRKELADIAFFGSFPKRCPECGAHMRKDKEEREVK